MIYPRPKNQAPVGFVVPLLVGALVIAAACAAGNEQHEGDGPGECTDRADNDADGAFDCSDDDCAGSPDCSPAGHDTGPTRDTGPADTSPDDTGACADAAGQIAVAPTEIFFRDLTSGFSTSAALTISNVGEEPLEILTVAETSDSSDAFYFAAVVGACLGAGEEITVSVVATLDAVGAADGELEITSSDLASPKLVVPLHAEATE